MRARTTLAVQNYTGCRHATAALVKLSTCCAGAMSCRVCCSPVSASPVSLSISGGLAGAGRQPALGSSSQEARPSAL